MAGGLVRAGGQRCLFCLPSRTQKNVFILELETSSLDDTEGSRTPLPQVPLLLKSYFTGVRCHGQYVAIPYLQFIQISLVSPQCSFLFQDCIQDTNRVMFNHRVP